MSELHPHTSGRKAGSTSSRSAGRKASSDFPLVPPILVSVREACRLLGICRDKFWAEAKRGAFGEIVGTKQKRYLFYRNLERYAANLERAPYSSKKKSELETVA